MRRLQAVSFLLAIIYAGIGLTVSTGKSAFRSDFGATTPRAPASVPEHTSESVKTVNPTSPTVSQIPRTSLWPSTGERWIFRFERKASAEFQSKTWVSLNLGGRVAIEAAGTHGETKFYLLTSETDRMEMGAKTQNGRRMFPPVRLEIDASGKLREMRWLSRENTSFSAPTAYTPSPEDADFLKDLVAQWFFFETTTRLGKADVEWSENASSPEMKSLTKRIVRYPSRPELSRLDSTHEWVARAKDGALRVERLEGTENFILHSANGDFDQKSSYRWLWTATEKTSVLAKVDSVGSVLDIADGSNGAAEKKPAIRFDPKRFAFAWAKIGSMQPKARLELFRSVKAALDGGQGELASIISKSLTGKNAMSVEWRTGVGALASSSNPEAAKALAALYVDGHRAPDEKLSILAGVTAGEGAPAPEWKDILESEVAAAPAPVDKPKLEVGEAPTLPVPHESDPAEAVREASLYALGSAIRKEDDVTRKKALESLLWKEIKDAKSETAQVALLEAIGNSGSAEYYSFVKDQFGSTNPQVRAKAVGAVRFLASDLARTIIEPARGDPSAIVRKAAEWSGKFQAEASN